MPVISTIDIDSLRKNSFKFVGIIVEIIKFGWQKMAMYKTRKETIERVLQMRKRSTVCDIPDTQA